MLDYKVCAQLREAGLTPPYTLEELISACGDGLFSLTKHGKFWQTNFLDGMAGETAGKTPIEAVANLYLSLDRGKDIVSLT